MTQWLRENAEVLLRHFRGAFIALLALLTLGLALDFFFRVFVSADPSARVYTPPAELSFRSPDTREQVLKRLEAWIPPRVVVVPPPPERELTLQGIFGSAKERRAAIVVAEPGGAPERVRATVGNVIEGWTVERIDASKVILRRGEEERELLMFARKERENP